MVFPSSNPWLFNWMTWGFLTETKLHRDNGCWEDPKAGSTGETRKRLLMWFFEGGSTRVGEKSGHWDHQQQLSQFWREDLMAGEDEITGAEWQQRYYILDSNPLNVLRAETALGRYGWHHIVPWGRVKELSVHWSRIKMQYCAIFIFLGKDFFSSLKKF